MILKKWTVNMMDVIYTYKTDDGNKLSLCFDEIHTIVDGIKFSLVGMPLLWDSKNEKFYKTELTDVILKMLTEEARKQRKTHVAGVTPPNTMKNERYGNFCESINFEYSNLEYLSVPGLAHSISNDGFLMPIYFNLEVLNKYAQNPKYQLEVLSSTYGDLRCGDEWHISFGVNSNKEVIMWLGDIDTLPIKEQQYLLSENIPSSFDLHSDFYDAQIECEWSQGSIESQCLSLRTELSDKIKKNYQADLYKLPNEIGKTIADLQKPIFWEERHVAPVVESLNRIFVESINESFLKSFLLSRNVELPSGIRALKLMGKFITFLSNSDKSDEIMLPFFVLYDYRVNVCHLQSEATIATKIQSINERLGLAISNISHEQIYDKLFEKIHDSLTKFEQLVQ